MATELRVMQDLPAEKVPQLNALVDEIGTLSAHPDINLHGLAKDLNFADLYTLVYRTFSQDAHPSATSLEHHVELTDAGKITAIRVGPDYVQLADTLAIAACSMLVAMDGFVDHFGTPEEKETMKALTKEYRELHEGTAPSNGHSERRCSTPST